MAGIVRARALAAAALVALAGAAAPARAGLFDDDEARRAILDIRRQIEQGREQTARQGEQISALSSQVEQLRRSILELNGNIEAQRADNAKVRGQMEELTRVVAELQRKQLDLQQGVDERIRKVEPQKVTVDDREFSVDPDEKRSYDEALAGFRRGEFERAASGFSGLLKRFPNTGYRQSALFWLGNAQYAQRAYKDAITSFRTLVATAPESPRAPEALLAIANCQAELKDPKAARRTIDELLAKYPKSEAAQAGRERLASLK